MKTALCLPFVFGIALCVLLLGLNLAYAQTIHAVPSSMIFEVVPPNVSPVEALAFYNSGLGSLTVAISISGPFALSENRCAKGVKSQTHCNVYLTYTASKIEQDTGTLTFDYGSGILAVPLIGNGVSGIPTSALLRPTTDQCDKIDVDTAFEMYGQIGVNDLYYALPTGEQVSISCNLGSETINAGTFTLEKIKTRQKLDVLPDTPYPPSFTPDEVGTWTCTMTYPGNGVLAPTSASATLIVGTTYGNRKCG